MIAQALVFGIVLGVFYGLVTIGLALLFGVMKYLNIAHGSFMMIGAYLFYWMFRLWDIDPFAAIPLVMLIMFILGCLVYKFLFSRLSTADEETRMNNSMLLTFGLVLVLDNSAIALWKTDIRTINTSYSGTMLEISDIRIPLTGILIIAVTIIIIFALHLFLSRTYLGKSIRATAQDWEAANLLGINIQHTYLISTGLSIALAGLAGCGIGVLYSFAPNIGLNWVLFAMVVLILAGVGNIKEVFLAGLIMGLLEQFGAIFMGGEYRGIVSLAIFILILVIRPQGLFKR